MMQIPKIEPKIAAMPGFSIMEEYNGWAMLSDIFGHYDLNRLRRELWDMYKSAIMEKEKFGKKVRRRHLTSLYETVNDLATAAYVLFEQKGFERYFEVNPVTAFFPVWDRFDYEPWDVLFKIFTDFSFDELRGELWDMYKDALTNTNIYHGRQEKHDMIFLFERLNDLVTAAYVIAREKFDQIQKGKAKKKADAKNS